MGFWTGCAAFLVFKVGDMEWLGVDYKGWDLALQASGNPRVLSWGGRGQVRVVL